MITRAAYFGGAIRTSVGTPATALTVNPRTARVWTLAGVDATDFFQLVDARKLGKGEFVYLVSEGFGYAVKDASGAVIANTAVGVIYKLILVDNSTLAGVWKVKGPPVMPNIAGLVLDFDASKGIYNADTGGSLITVDGTAIGRAEDQSGGGRHVIQATVASRPLWKASILNGLPVMRFDGSNDALRRDTFLLGDMFGTSNTKQTIFSVHKTTVAKDQRLFSVESGGTLWRYSPPHVDGKLYYTAHSSGGAEINVTAPGGYATSWRTDTLQRDDLNMLIRSNGVQLATNTVTGGNSTGGIPLVIGGFDEAFANWGGDLARFLVYAATVTPSDILLMEAYLRAIYAHY